MCEQDQHIQQLFVVLGRLAQQHQRLLQEPRPAPGADHL